LGLRTLFNIYRRALREKPARTFSSGVRRRKSE
jgi:hypothetical protein